MKSAPKHKRRLRGRTIPPLPCGCLAQAAPKGRAHGLVFGVGCLSRYRRICVRHERVYRLTWELIFDLKGNVVEHAYRREKRGLRGVRGL